MSVAELELKSRQKDSRSIASFRSPAPAHHRLSKVAATVSCRLHFAPISHDEPQGLSSSGDRFLAGGRRTECRRDRRHPDARSRRAELGGVRARGGDDAAHPARRGRHRLRRADHGDHRGVLLVVVSSYRQTIAAYPAGGGSYTVARRNLGVRPGLLAAAALLLDYVLVVAVGISAGVGALVSAVPSLQPHTLAHLPRASWLFITVVNLRGVRESGLAFMVPTYLFVGCLFSVLVDRCRQDVADWRPAGAGRRAAVAARWPRAAPASWLLLRAFASGCTAMTGVEAVSNGVAAFREPAVRNARRTLTVIIAHPVVLLVGIAFLCAAPIGIAATEPGTPGYQSVLSQLVAAVVGRGVVLLRLSWRRFSPCWRCRPTPDSPTFRACAA